MAQSFLGKEHVSIPGLLTELGLLSGFGQVPGYSGTVYV